MDTSRVEIREARPEDAEKLIAFIQRASQEPNIGILTGPGEFNISVEEEQQFLLDHAERDNSIFLLAVVEGEIVGALSCTGGKRRATRHNTTLGITVDKDWRDLGVGSALMQRALDWAKGTGVVTRVELEVFVNNPRAIHVYEKCGFQIEGRRRNAFYRNGEYIDGLIMAVLLARGE